MSPVSCTHAHITGVVCVCVPADLCTHPLHDASNDPGVKNVLQVAWDGLGFSSLVVVDPKSVW